MHFDCAILGLEKPKGVVLAMDKQSFEQRVFGINLEDALAWFDWEGFFPIVEKKSGVVVGVAYADQPNWYRHLKFDEEKEAYFV